MNREKFKTRKIRLVGDAQLKAALSLIPNLPIDPKKPIELVIREEVKERKLDQNALMWVGPLKDISEQAYIEGRRFSEIVWHEHFKEQYLPNEFEPGFDPDLVKDSEKYKKYDYTPSGKRVLVGSTTDLSIKGFAQYLEQIYAEGANLGVQFHANPKLMKVAA